MVFTNENALLFDDVETLEANFGKGFLNTVSANANCDCVSYPSIVETASFENVSVQEK